MVNFNKPIDSKDAYIIQENHVMYEGVKPNPRCT